MGISREEAGKMADFLDQEAARYDAAIRKWPADEYLSGWGMRSRAFHAGAAALRAVSGTQSAAVGSDSNPQSLRNSSLYQNGATGG